MDLVFPFLRITLSFLYKCSVNFSRKTKLRQAFSFNSHKLNAVVYLYSVYNPEIIALHKNCHLWLLRVDSKNFSLAYHLTIPIILTNSSKWSKPTTTQDNYSLITNLAMCTSKCVRWRDLIPTFSGIFLLWECWLLLSDLKVLSLRSSLAGTSLMFECCPIITVNQANVHISNCNQCSFVCTGLQTAHSHMMLTRGTSKTRNLRSTFMRKHLWVILLLLKWRVK